MYIIRWNGDNFFVITTKMTNGKNYIELKTNTRIFP